MSNSSLSSLASEPVRLSHQIVVVGGGSAGITVAAQLRVQDPSLDIVIIEPSAHHYYQPAWTLVGGGDFNIQKTVKPEADCIPEGVTWIQDAVTDFDPDHNTVLTQAGKQVQYEYLIVCPGIQINWQAIAGLVDSLGKNGVCSNYAFDAAPYTWEAIRNFQGGTAIFTVPATPIKCGGAPQKIMYLADDAFRRNNVRDRANIRFCTALGGIFPVPLYAERLLQVVERRDLNLDFKHNLKAIHGKEAVFDVTTDEGVTEKVIPFDLIHVTPPMGPPDFIKTSKLAVPDGPTKGWVDVNKATLQHNVYPNVFSLGDASSLPTSKTAAAIRRQAPVLVQNLTALMAARSLSGEYGGYTCCPLITGYGQVIMAEFDYRNLPMSTFSQDPREERYSMWLMKRYVLPWVYWNRMLKGQPFEGDALGLKGWSYTQPS
jgi:sulfide:quinone oxidoreductase